MTLPLNSRLSALYDTNGTQKEFSFGFRVFFDPDNGGYGLEVRRQTADGYEVIPKSDYLVLPVEDNSAGVVRFSVAPSAGQQIYIAGKTPTIQQLVLTNFGRYSAESIETQFDFITAIIQEWLSALDEETRQRIAADDILTQYVVNRIDDFVQQVNQNWDDKLQEWDDKSQEIEDYIASIMPSFAQTLREEIEAYAVAGMQDAIDQTLADSKSEIDDAVAGMQDAIDQTLADSKAEIDDAVAGMQDAIDQTLADSKAEIDDAVSRANAAATAAAITVKLYDTPEAGVDPVTGVADGAYFNVRSSNDESYVDEYQNIGGVATPSGKTYPSSAYVQKVADFTPLPFVAGKTYGLYGRVTLANGDIVKNTVANNTNNPNADITGWINEYAFKKYYLSSFGAIPNDPSFAAYNEAILVNALNLGAVIVDGEYYVSCSKSWGMTGSVRLLGFGESSKINFTKTTGGWLKLPSIDELLLDGVNINASNPSLTHSLFAGIDDTIYIKSFTLKNSIINFPNGRIFSQQFSRTTNPYTMDFGIKRTFIGGNTFNGTAMVIRAINMPFDSFIAVDNNLHNSESCTFYLANDNAHTYESQLKDKQKLALFNRNTVINDDDFFSTQVQVYYCLALVECNACFYEGNHVEGLKTRVNDVVVYDIYANANFLLAKNNTWKNNLAMTPTKMYSDLMKAKGSIASIYTKNTYILEEDFVVRHNATGAGIPWVQAFAKTSITQNSKFVMLDNTIDVYQLLGMASTNLTKHVDIRRNTIKAKYFAGTFLFIRNTHENVSTYSDTDVIFKDNEFYFENTGGITRNDTPYNSSWLVGMVHTPNSEQGDYRSIVVKGNSYTIGQAAFTTALISDLTADTIDVSDNEVTIRGGIENFRMWAGLSGKNVINKNKVIDLSDGLIRGNAINARYPIAGTFELGFDFIGKYNRGFGFEITKPTKPIFLKLKNTLTSVSGSYSYSYTLKLDASGITYIDNETGVETTAAYPNTAGEYEVFTPKQYVTDVLDTAVLSTVILNNEYIKINTGFTTTIADNTETIQSLKVTAIS